MRRWSGFSNPPPENALPVLMNSVPPDAPPQFVAINVPEFRKCALAPLPRGSLLTPSVMVPLTFHGAQVRQGVAILADVCGDERAHGAIRAEQDLARRGVGERVHRQDVEENGIVVGDVDRCPGVIQAGSPRVGRRACAPCARIVPLFCMAMLEFCPPFVSAPL